jgi:threonylcarbamoyladenosine tRNA methylthiotransferase MtaB
MKAAFYTLGCKVNKYETQIMEQRLSGAGFEIVPSDCNADVYIINSCTVTAESDRKTRQIIRRLKKQNPNALTVLTGCFPQSSPVEAESMSYVDVITGTKERGFIDKIIAEALQTGCRIVRISEFEKSEKFESMSADNFSERTRAFVKIEDGCTRFCSYCIIPFSRGPVRSKPLNEITEELTVLSEKGYKEIVLVGINLSAYGKDLNLNLEDAIEVSEHINGIERVRLGSLEPNLIDEDFIKRMKPLRKLCCHFHLSLQSGCEETLKRMNRHYTPSEYQKAVDILRQAFACCAITTDIIVGFPGETELEFAESLEFVKKIGFSQAHVFMYSKRKGTKAAELPGQIEKSEKERRSKIMIEACLESRNFFLSSHCGKTLPVLFERCGKENNYEGFTSDYAPVKIISSQDLQGRLINVTIKSTDNEFCYGEILRSAECSVQSEKL